MNIFLNFFFFLKQRSLVDKSYISGNLERFNFQKYYGSCSF